MRSVATFRSLVQPVITAWRGPVDYAYDPYAYPLPIPTVTDINVTVTTGLDVDLTADPLD
jgi:sporulation-control protein spo0M